MRLEEFKSRRQFIKFLRLWDEGKLKKEDVIKWLKNTKVPQTLPLKKTTNK